MDILDSQSQHLQYEFVTVGKSMGGSVLMNLLNRCKGFIEKVGSVTTINAPLLGGNLKKVFKN